MLKKLLQLGGLFVLSSLFAPVAVFDKLELVGSIGFIFFGKIVLCFADTANQGD